MDICIFVDTDDNLRFIRRLDRDINQRGRTVSSVMKQYLETVNPVHMEFVKPSRKYADLIVPEGGRNQIALNLLTVKLEALINQRIKG